jgi:WD40 repeat protein
MIRSKRTLRICLVLAVAASTGCQNPMGDPPPVDVQLPAPVGPDGFFTGSNPFQPDVQWAPDGRTIYAIIRSAPPNGVTAIDVFTNQTRVVAAAENMSFQVLRISHDGAFLFYSSERQRAGSNQAREGYTISRIPTSGTASEELVRGASHVFGISPDGRMLAWTTESTPDSLFVRDLTSGETRYVTSGYPLSISPDHSTLLHSSLPLVSITATDLATGSGSTAQRRVKDVRWGPAGAELLFRDVGTVMVQRGISGAPETLWTATPDAGSRYIDALTWSPDGTRVAASLSEGCFQNPCRRQLLLIDVATRAARVLVNRRGASLSQAIFSPDGQRIAVTSGGRLYVIPVN